MTTTEVEQLLDEYKAGLEAELALLRQLATLAQQQKDSTALRNFEQFAAHSDERDRVTRNLVTVEEGLSQVRSRLAARKVVAASLPAYAVVVDLRRRAADLVSEVLSVDQESLKALADAEMARRAALASLERGETTLAAYRKVLTPPIEHAALLDRRG